MFSSRAYSFVTQTNFGVLLQAFEQGPGLSSMSPDKAKLKVATQFAK